jgi:hypothetical protein
MVGLRPRWVLTKILKDYARRLVPLTETDAKDMLSSLRVFPVVQKSPARLQGLIAAVKSAAMILNPCPTKRSRI